MDERRDGHAVGGYGEAQELLARARRGIPAAHATVGVEREQGGGEQRGRHDRVWVAAEDTCGQIAGREREAEEAGVVKDRRIVSVQLVQQTQRGERVALERRAGLRQESLVGAAQRLHAGLLGGRACEFGEVALGLGFVALPGDALEGRGPGECQRGDAESGDTGDRTMAP
jgi:hypothetical protein